MKKFLTLIKRDLTDYRGALIITPFAIALVILLVSTLSAIGGKMHIGGQQIGLTDGKFMIYEDEKGTEWKVYRNDAGNIIKSNGQTEMTFDNNIDPKDKEKTGKIIGVATTLPSLLPIGVAIIAIYFVLSGALFEERKERNIMFWKSLPISDLETVGAKATSIIGGGLGAAIAASLMLQIGLVILIYFISLSTGLNIFDFGALINGAISVWGLILITLIAFVFWAFPIYGWFLAVSAYAPKSPIFAAALPILLMPVIGKILLNDKTTEFLATPLQHMTGEPALMALFNAMEKSENSNGINESLKNIDLQPIFETFANPQMWIGIIIGAAFIYLASEIRRRKAL